MIFMILNILIGGGLIAFSFTIDSHKSSHNGNPLVNLTLMLASIFILMGVSLLCCLLGAPDPMCLLLGRLTFLFMGMFCMGGCHVVLTFGSEKSNTFLKVLQWILNIACLVFIFFVPHMVTGFSIKDGAFRVISDTLVETENIKITWFNMYCLVCIVGIPFVTDLMLLIRAENTKDRLLRQNLVLMGIGFFATWISYALLFFACLYQPMMFSLILLCLVPQLVIFVRASSNDQIWGKSLIFRTFLRSVLIYILPSVVEGLIFAGLRMIFPNRGIVYYILLALGTSVVVLVWVLTGRRFTRMDAMRDSNYSEDFENAITSIDFEGDPAVIMSNLRAAFEKYVDTTEITLAVDADTGFLESVFTEEDKKIAIPIDDPCFDVLLNLKHQIVFRSFAEHDYSVQSVRGDLLHLLDSTNSEAFIMLNEGRHIVGVLFLGAKTSHNPFNEYDYNVFTKLYSNFFVVGYYMKNIMNESVVGTVNREIRMSSQIITSIQENMDYIKNPKIDAGYRMIPAHNIGGEFIDMIRLNDQKHMFIIGALNGKGIAASMSMVILKSIIRTDLAETPDFKLLVEKINTFIRNSLPKGTFFAGTFGVIDFSNDTMYYINCGSPALFMYNHIYNNVIEIQGEGHVLGFAKDISKLIRIKKVKLSEGDIVLACTDGLIEAKSLRGEGYGKTRVQSQMMENATFPADKMAQFSYDNLVEFTSRALEDDITVLVLKYLGGK
ncbi:MAG: serine/threonine-protein phosphatase [Treponema sp.]|nr:serine/threonine-protein phosphatase [Treponema sp.]